MHSFKIAAGQHRSIALEELEDMAAEMRATGLVVEDTMFYICFLDALPAEYEVGFRQQTGKTYLGREENMRTYGTRTVYTFSRRSA